MGNLNPTYGVAKRSRQLYEFPITSKMRNASSTWRMISDLDKVCREIFMMMNSSAGATWFEVM